VPIRDVHDEDGSLLLRGVHPAIAVVSADAATRQVLVSALGTLPGVNFIDTSAITAQVEVEAQRLRAEHDGRIARQEQAVAAAADGIKDAVAATAESHRRVQIAQDELARFDELTHALAAAEDAYELAVRADAENARSLATSLGELERVLGQRRSAAQSLDEARRGNDGRLKASEAIQYQAMAVQVALAKAETDQREAVRRAEEQSLVCRAASRDALLTLERAHAQLRSTASDSVASSWGPGVPLAGVLAEHRDHLSTAIAGADAAEGRCKELERAADSRRADEQRRLDALVNQGPEPVDEERAIAAWLATTGSHGADETVVIDDAFRSMSADAVVGLITGLAERRRAQVIYMTDDAGVLGWAISLPHETGGICVARSGQRRPALVND
jgi:hypothetical protein